MSESRNTSDIWVAIACGAVLIVIAGFLSSYAARQSSLSLAQKVDAAIASPARRSTWTTIREGYVLGRAVPKKGHASYVVAARRFDGEYRAIAEVDADGSVLRMVPIGGSNGFVYGKRLGVLFARASKGVASADRSPLDAPLEPLVVSMLETIAALERSRTEALDADGKK
ncbi:MAG: hypothetical protein CVV47_17020 [Spirochaetae bacterium HGW-Spirochaetae-3]|jgi:hypothetical protein|nr:MAG: hypothetical protein CVV47_17020 [Spirochaetae bacterium HGW-Spirochaetae-3]